MNHRLFQLMSFYCQDKNLFRSTGEVSHPATKEINKQSIQNKQEVKHHNKFLELQAYLQFSEPIL